MGTKHTRSSSLKGPARRKLLRAIPSGLYVAGLRSGLEVHALTLSWLTQISMEPPMILLGVRENTHSLEMIESGRVLTINYLSRKSRKTLEHFFKPVPKDGNRLGGWPYETERTGAPILKDAIGYLECRVVNVIKEFGDHAAVIAEVIEAVVREDVPPMVMADTPWHYGG